MARVFARLLADGAICELLRERDDIEREFNPEFIKTQCVEVTGLKPPPEIGWVRGANGRFAAPAPFEPSLAQQAAAAQSAGLHITLSGSVTLATVFPTDPAAQRKLAAVAAAIGLTGGFPGGAPARPMRDMAGEWHSFDLAQWKAVAGAIAAYVAALDLIIDGNPLGAAGLPAASVTLNV